MQQYFSTGTFAKMANVTQRTLRYYDKIGLLKPSFVMENGYRQYDNNDFLKLQKIISLKQLGFSIEEIFPLLLNDSINLKDSFIMQQDLIRKRIIQLQSLNDALKSATKLLDSGQLDWSKVIELVHLTNVETDIVDQYKNTTNLNVRIRLHEQYSTNPIGWFQWVYSQIDFTGVYRLLEVGCGNGELWKGKRINTRNREMFLSDGSAGMIEEVRQKLGEHFNCIVCDCESIPFKNNYFDTLVANHVLFYLRDITSGLKEINRVLKSDGTFYCTTYGKHHMKEINELVKEFDNQIVLSETSLVNNFGLDNGREILQPYFKQITLVKYEDGLHIDEVDPLVEYILSCHGNQNEIIGKRLAEFKQFITNKLKMQKYITVTKDAGMFVCKK